MRLHNAFRKAARPFTAVIENNVNNRLFVKIHRFGTDREADIFVSLSRLQFKTAHR